MAYIDNDAKSYGDALFMLADELNQADEMKDDLSTLCKTISENPDYLKLLDTPALSREERVKLADEAFNGLNKNLVNLVKILIERRVAYLIFKIRDAYMSSYDVSRGIERVEAITVLPLTDIQLSKLQNKLANITGKQIIIKNTIDSSILGGMKLRYLGIQIDGSVKTKLDNFEQSLKDIVI
jgi:F-type H+-transporting ATPase subunit delta